MNLDVRSDLIVVIRMYLNHLGIQDQISKLNLTIIHRDTTYFPDISAIHYGFTLLAIW